MSFITKRERVFNEYELYELPSRNEGKLKTYSSCTDARAWSHFGSDKSEHLVDIIKRNNEMCRPKYVPTEAIVNTLLSVKNAEITRLKRKIEEFEEMLAAYDELELTCEQKCEIAEAHAAIKEANKELNELWFDLDLSGFTGIDSEDFETGKSRGDEASRHRDEEPDIEPPHYKGDEPSQKESKGNQAGMHCACDASTNATDPRIDELKETLISKDAKLNAMKNTIAVMENDVCEPYCIYAHIYTALEKIFGVLCQNDKYKLYLNLMTAGKDTRCIDIKGKILYKLKVFEKFSMALIAPCSQDAENSNSQQDCSCYRAEIASRVETTYALTSAETQQPGVDNKRAQLVADIMQNEEMKEILNRENTSEKTDLNLDDIEIESYNADEENLKRLKNLQENYDDLMTCYEGLKHEKDCLQIRCKKYEEMEKELESLKSQLREYNSLWNEKEHFRKRSEDLDTLKKQYLVLYDETTNLETELKAESEINSVKTKTIEELRNDNILLEEKLNKASMCFEKERSCVQCKIKECECTIMCQKQQIKSLTLQIDRLLEQAPDKGQSKSDTPDINLIDEINSLKEQIANLKDALYCNEEEKEQLQEEYKNKLDLINDLRMEVEDWKSSYEKMLHRNEYLEKYTESYRDEVQKLVANNKILTEDNDAKSNAIENLREVIYRKSQEVKKLMEDIDLKNAETSNLCNEIQNLQEAYNINIKALDAEKSKELQLVKQESHDLLNKVKDYDDLVQKQESLTHTFHSQNEEYIQLKTILTSATAENNNLRINLGNFEKINSSLRQEIQKLQEINNVTVDNLGALQDEKDLYKVSLELTRKDSKRLEEEILRYKDLSDQLDLLKKSHEKLIIEKNSLENELTAKTIELDNAIHAIQLTRKASMDLENKLKYSENVNTDLMKIDEAYKALIKEQKQLQAELEDQKQAFDGLSEAFEDLKLENIKKTEEVMALLREFDSLKSAYNTLLAEKQDLQDDYDNKNEEINNLCNNLEKKIEENRELFQEIQKLRNLEEDNFATKSTLTALRKESKDLMIRAKYCDTLQAEYNQLKKDHDRIKAENDELQRELNRMEKDNRELNSESQILLSHSEDLEKALINARTQLVNTSVSRDPHTDIIREIEELRKEKLQQYERIRDLRDKLDSTEITISELGENIQTRDHKIASLQNHINQLQDEVKQLHLSLAEVVNAGEQIRDNSYHKINQSLQSMEAHHSKATHNMKMELVKLQNENFNLEERLSTSKIRSEDSIRDKNKYLSQVIRLQNEREIIVTDIKQLELKSVGDSALSPENCETENILASLDRIRKFLESKSSKSMLLEQSLTKIQNSYQLVQDKADEAKKIVEKEKQKILNEKEEAIKDKAIMEKQLLDLKEQLEKQIFHDKGVIKDLEAEILNQKLIADKVNKSRESYILKLKEEMESFEQLYHTASEKISELEMKLKNMSDENNKNLDFIARVNIELQQKSEEIKQLQRDLNNIKNKVKKSESIQTLIDCENVEIQTDKEQFINYDDNTTQNKDKNNDYDDIKAHKKKSGTFEAKNVPLNKLKAFNEVQVLTAKVEPNFVFDRNSYQNYKLQQLSTGRLEQHSFACLSENENTVGPSFKKMNIKEKSSQRSEDINVVDIYNKLSIDTDSSKVPDADKHGNKEKQKKHDTTSGFTGLRTESFETESSVQQNTNLLGSVFSGDKDLFVIYKDSDSVNANRSHDEQQRYKNYQSEKQNVKGKDGTKKGRPKSSKNRDPDSDIFLYGEENIDDDDSVKQRLNINMPRVDAISPTVTGSDADKKSLDSYIVYDIKSEIKKSSGENYRNQSAHSISNDETQYFESYVSTEEEHTSKNLNSGKPDRNNFVLTSDSTQPNNLSNTSPGSTFVKNDLDRDPRPRGHHIDGNKRELPGTDYKKQRNDNGNFGLDYILQADNIIKMYNATQGLRGTHSDHFVDNMIKIHNRSDSSPSRLSPGKKSFTDFKTVSSGTTCKSKSKTGLEGFIMVKADTVNGYENRIKELTQHLENIERDYKKKLEAIKMQYDSNIRSILNEHNQGVKNIQGLHEDTLQDILMHHENEVENLRSMSIEAMKKADKLEKENRCLRCKMHDPSIDEEPTRITTELKRRRRSRIDTKMLSKTNVEAFNVRPKSRCNGPCTCSVDVNLSDTIRNMFEQVDVEQRKMAEHTYLKHIANKILTANVEALDCQELSFLHLKVCRIWKVKLSKEESLKKRIDSLETELINKQRHTQHNMAELDRKVAEERRRLQEVREAVCRNVPTASRLDSPDNEASYIQRVPATVAADSPYDIQERRSAGDLAPASSAGLRIRRGKTDNRAVLAKMDSDERREKKLPYNDEPPTRLRRQHDRPSSRQTKK